MQQPVFLRPQPITHCSCCAGALSAAVAVSGGYDMQGCPVIAASRGCLLPLGNGGDCTEHSTPAGELGHPRLDYAKLTVHKEKDFLLC